MSKILSTYMYLLGYKTLYEMTQKICHDMHFMLGIISWHNMSYTILFSLPKNGCKTRKTSLLILTFLMVTIFNDLPIFLGKEIASQPLLV